ncbi:MAG: porphobilinogen synthase [Ignavibacteriota bacterium]|nr:MAG: porphobilinogen synthase [Chlorobiota bacterium]MBE7475703.1 porphobilinogen synthase [Ignavibacteriales bacterium]MBL1122988.1 porphobilinogen synthase [Ignavibacteriota bacterium]MCE7856078.1 porphobilinogen synthase [Ignavibacteria bacterium CHB3]MCZ7615362.1 porphobilinogen synthase [Ignavibacteriaceae bacterium]MEB2296853.1 porphobilinogen synthase [Ignavibacteria bacterium]
MPEKNFTFKRFRRLRYNPIVRDMVRETVLTKNDLIYPLFVVPGNNVKKPVKSMPGVFQLSVENLVTECKEVRDLGIPAVILFGIPEHKDEQGSDAYNPNGIIQQAIRAIKKEIKDLLIITDVCLCEYTSHGHCGILDGEDILNDETITVLAKEAVSHVEAGADMVAPSDMMDGRVLAIRKALDHKGYTKIPIMSYAAKYASGYYGPFRDAAESTPAFGDRRSHQMDIGNINEALREVETDIEEGADIVMVKPAGPYLDVIRKVKEKFGMPTAAYQVSGEFSMIKAAGQNGWIDEERVMIESLTAIKRAGADMILTYFAKDVAKWIDKTRK